MKVSELIKILRDLPPDLIVTVKTAEFGLNDCDQVLPTFVGVVGHKPTIWYGKYEILPYESAPNAVLIK